MRINEILTESQLQQLDEGPIGSALGAVGRGIGRVAGGLAKGVGAVAGGVVGAGRALKKGYQSGKAVVGDDPDPNAGAPGYEAPPEKPEPTPAASGSSPAPAPAAAAPSSGAAPAAGTATPPPTGGTTAPTAQQINAQGPKGTAPARAQTGAAAQALQKTAQATQGAGPEKAGQTLYAQVKSSVDQLDKKGKQRILQLLQKSLTAPAAKAAPGATAPAAGPGSKTAGTTAAGQPKVEPDLNAPAAPAATPAPAAAEPTPAKKKGGRKSKPAAPSQAEIDADRQRLMGPTSDSIIRPGHSLAETLANRVEIHKQKMFETGLARGQISIFRK